MDEIDDLLNEIEAEAEEERKAQRAKEIEELCMCGRADTCIKVKLAKQAEGIK